MPGERTGVAEELAKGWGRVWPRIVLAASRLPSSCAHSRAKSDRGRERLQPLTQPLSGHDEHRLTEHAAHRRNRRRHAAELGQQSHERHQRRADRSCPAAEPAQGAAHVDQLWTQLLRCLGEARRCLRRRHRGLDRHERARQPARQTVR